MGPEPTIWEWVVFWVGVIIVVYAFWVFVADRIPGLAGVGTVTRKASVKLFFIFVDRAGGWLIRWVYAPIGRAIVGLARALWSGPQPAREAAPPVPVTTIAVPLPRSYVAGVGRAPHQNAPSAPSAVRPSVSSAADPPSRPAVPPAVERLMADRSREALLDALVAAGWSTTQIRGQLRGANDAIGREVEAAQARLERRRATPVAGRELAEGVEFR